MNKAIRSSALALIIGGVIFGGYALKASADIPDTTPPTGGGLGYDAGFQTHVPNGDVGEVMWVYITHFTDPSGIKSEILREYEAPLQQGVCGAYAKVDSDQNAAGSSQIGYSYRSGYPWLLDGHCYYFQLVATDNADNVATYNSPLVIKYDTTAPSAPALSQPYRSISSFPLTMYMSWAAASDAQSGIAYYKYGFSEFNPFGVPAVESCTEAAPTSWSTTPNMFQQLAINEGDILANSWVDVWVKPVNNAGIEGPTSCRLLSSDSVAPTTTISATTNGASYIFGNPTNHDVIVTLGCSDPGVGCDKAWYSLNGGSTWSDYSTPVTISSESVSAIQFYSQDLVGNAEIAGSRSIAIDKTAPIITIAPYLTIPTNQDITVNASVNEGSLNATSHVFSDNGSFTFTASDAAGNSESTTVTITNIDKTSPPIPSITTFTTKINASNVGKVSLAGKAESGSTIYYTINNSSKTPVTGTIAVDGSGDYLLKNINVSSLADGTLTVTLHATDLAGNESKDALTTALKDVISPTAWVSYSTSDGANYSTSDWTNQDVVATLHPSESITGSSSHNFAANGDYTFNFIDAAGNTGSTVATVSKIDKIAPSVELGYGWQWHSEITLTPQSVSDSGGSGITAYHWEQRPTPTTLTFGSPDAYSTTVSSTSDGEFTIRLTVTDAAGKILMKLT